MILANPRELRASPHLVNEKTRHLVDESFIYRWRAFSFVCDNKKDPRYEDLFIIILVAQVHLHWNLIYSGIIKWKAIKDE